MALNMHNQNYINTLFETNSHRQIVNNHTWADPRGVQGVRTPTFYTSHLFDGKTYRVLQIAEEGISHG